jgi:hypothetical protein
VPEKGKPAARYDRKQMLKQRKNYQNEQKTNKQTNKQTSPFTFADKEAHKRTKLLLLVCLQCILPFCVCMECVNATNAAICELVFCFLHRKLLQKIIRY